jgi:hypothetical protein
VRAAGQGTSPEDVVVFHTLDKAEARAVVLELDDDGDIDPLLVDTDGTASGMHDAVATDSDLVHCPMQLSPVGPRDRDRNRELDVAATDPC